MFFVLASDFSNHYSFLLEFHRFPGSYPKVIFKNFTREVPHELYLFIKVVFVIERQKIRRSNKGSFYKGQNWFWNELWLVHYVGVMKIHMSFFVMLIFPRATKRVFFSFFVKYRYPFYFPFCIDKNMFSSLV